MPYYRTIEEDLHRAKEIIERGKILSDIEVARFPVDIQPEIRARITDGGTIYGSDTHAAYQLLKSFVEQIEKDRFYYRDLEEHMRRVVKEVKGAPALLLHDNRPYKAIPEDLADAIERLV